MWSFKKGSDILRQLCLNVVMKPWATFLASIILFFAISSFAADKPVRKYDIQLHRAVKVGKKYRLIVKGSWLAKEERTAGTEVAKSKMGFETEFRGIVTVLENTNDGGQKKLALQVERFAITEKGKTSDVLPKGARLLAALEKRKAIFGLAMKDGKIKPLETGRTVQALQMLISLANEEDANDDEVFGSKKKRAEGEVWDINKKLAIANMERDGILVKPENFSGQTKFPKIVNVGKVECVYLEGGFKAKDFRPPLPKTFEVLKSEFTAQYSGKFPLTTKLPELETTVDVRTMFTALAPAKGVVPAIELSSERRTQKHIWVEPLN